MQKMEKKFRIFFKHSMKRPRLSLVFSYYVYFCILQNKHKNLKRKLKKK